MYYSSHYRRGFTLVEIMIVVVIIGLLAAMAIPAFQKVRLNSVRGVMDHDARMLAQAAHQYYLQTNSTTVLVTVDAAGAVGGPLSSYVRQVGRGYTAVTSPLAIDSDFSMSHPLLGAVNFNAEGHRLP